MDLLPVILVLLGLFVGVRLVWMAAIPSARQITPPRPSGRRAATLR